jgi:hypothetical protein
VAIITIASNVGFNLTMQQRGLPIAYLMSLGNRLKFDLHDAINVLARFGADSALVSARRPFFTQKRAHLRAF